MLRFQMKTSNFLIAHKSCYSDVLVSEQLRNSRLTLLESNKYRHVQIQRTQEAERIFETLHLRR